MRLLKSEQDFSTYRKRFPEHGVLPILPPAEYPCYAYEVTPVYGWQYEEDVPAYLYMGDLDRMLTKVKEGV